MDKLKEYINNQISSLRGDSRSSKVKRNILGSFIVKGISVMISLTLVPLTISYVSSELYGIWLTLASIISWVSIFDLGFGNGLRNRIAECIAKYQWVLAKSYISTAYLYFALVFFPIAFVVFIISGFVDWPNLLNISEDYQDVLVKVMRIVIVFLALNMLVRIQGTVLSALQKNALASFFDTLGQLLVLVVIYILTITTTPSLIYLAWAISASPIVVGLVVGIWIYGVKYRRLSPSIRLANRNLVKSVLNLGLNFFVIQIAVIVLYQTMNIIISNVAGPKAVTEYTVVYQYTSIPLMVISIIMAPFWSAFTDAYTLKDFGWMKSTYAKLMKLYLMGIAVLVAVFLLHPIAFKLWLGDKVEIHLPLVVVCTIYVMIMMWNSIHSTLINGTGLIKLSLYTTVFSIIVNIPLAIALGKLLGAAGVVISVGLLNLTGVVIMRLQIKKIINNTATGIWSK